MKPVNQNAPIKPAAATQPHPRFASCTQRTHVLQWVMDTTIRNLDEGAYRSLKARAALAGKTIGEMVNEAIRAYLARPDFPTGPGSLQDLTPEEYPEGTERLSEDIDSVVYGA